MNNNHKSPPAAGIYATDVAGKHLTWDKRQALLKMVIENPGQAAPIPQFKTAGDNLAHVVYSSAAFGGKGGLANPYGGFTNLPGSRASAARLRSLLAGNPGLRRRGDRSGEYPRDVKNPDPRLQ